MLASFSGERHHALSPQFGLTISHSQRLKSTLCWPQLNRLSPFSLTRRDLMLSRAKSLEFIGQTPLLIY